ncbi:type IV secretion IcmS family protein [Candidiatus Paracoxiella cheracis]|uniref:type IV secretion IcmS family protein n=1 Tax=Candidiatus Paracoxiella cheracis TaxID=3405120 RepID=UPI003BF55EB3
MKLANKLIAMTKQIGASFTLKGRPISYNEIFADTGLLPGLTKRADQLSSLCLGYGLGATFEDVEKSLLGVKVSFDDFTPDVLRLFCILDVLYELVKSSPSKEAVPLDELMYD